MSIEEQIKKLQRIKAHIELYERLKDNINDEANKKEEEHSKFESEHPGLLTQFIKEISSFCDKKVKELNNYEFDKKNSTKKQNKLPEKQETKDKKQDIAKTKKESVHDPFSDVPEDPLRFALKYKHLEGKRVSIETNNGEVSGVIRGVNVPNIVVETDTNYTIQVPPKDLQLEKED